VAQVVVDVRREATSLRVGASDGLRLRGTTITVHSSGLDAGEPYAVRIGDRRVATGTAGSLGRVDRAVRIPTGTPEGRTSVVVTGSEQDRRGRDTVRVVAAKQLGLALGKADVRASDPQTVTVSRLAAGERVTVTYQGTRVSPGSARADARGRWRGTFPVGTTWGTKAVKVTGQFATRNATATFDVVRRCSSGHVCP
jgi:hypothetical protein